jgi:hypothetical protein
MESTEILDYPAAHSMDTYWFAVDADGNVAMFDTGEGGAVPEDALRSEDGLDYLFAEIAKESEHRSIRVDTSGDIFLTEPTTVGARNGIDGSVYMGSVCNLILLLESDELIPQLGVQETDTGYTVRFAGEQTIVYVSKCPLVNIQKLIADRQAVVVRSVLCDFDYPLAAQLGLFEYEHDNHVLIPYHRKYVPQYPLKLEDLPDRLQTKIIEAGIDRVKFAESELVQPLEHTPCNAWSGTDYWLDTQGIEHTPETKLRNTWNPVNQTWVDEDGVEYS